MPPARPAPIAPDPDKSGLGRHTVDFDTGRRWRGLYDSPDVVPVRRHGRYDASAERCGQHGNCYQSEGAYGHVYSSFLVHNGTACGVAVLNAAAAPRFTRCIVEQG
jgi:hypothetical protein